MIIHKDPGVVRPDHASSDLEFFRNAAADNPQSTGQDYSTTERKNRLSFSYSEIIPLQSDQDKFRSAVILIQQPVRQPATLSWMTPGTQHHRSENQPAIELLTLRQQLFRQERLLGGGTDEWALSSMICAAP